MQKKSRLNYCASILAALFCAAWPLSCAASPNPDGAGRTVIPFMPAGRVVDTNMMRQIYDEVKTPFKYGVVLKGASTNELVDCPSIFRSGGRWYMMFAAITNKVGYQTFLARSDDLLHWERLGKILSFAATNAWDAWQADGGIALADYRWDGSHELEKFDGKFWLSYIGGAKKGYETDPLSTRHRVDKIADENQRMEPHFRKSHFVRQRRGRARL